MKTWTLCVCLLVNTALASDLPRAEEVMRKTGVRQGLAVVLDATDGTFESGLASDGRILVQTLTTDAAACTTAREHLFAQGLYGQASVDYVANLLRDKGFDVQTPEYVRLERGAPGNPVLDVGGLRWSVVQASLLTSTAPGGLTAPTLHPVKPAGCVPDDYGTVNLRGAIAVVDDAVCSVVDKGNLLSRSVTSG